MPPIQHLRKRAAKAIKKSDRAGAKKRRIERARKDRKSKHWQKDTQ